VDIAALKARKFTNIMRQKAIRWIDWTREQELKALKEWFDPIIAGGSVRLLEIGGGNGFLASHLARLGFEVVSIDPKPRQPSHYQVQPGDSTHLAFDDNSFDIIFSSNVLEHITDLTTALGEMKRVLKPSGVMIHSMPTPFTTMLTMLSQPIGYMFGVGFVIQQAMNVLRSVISSRKQLSSGQPVQVATERESKSVNKQNIREALRMLNPLRLVVSPPHGVSSSCLQELRDWKSEVWCRQFERHGFMVESYINLPVVYSRHAIFPFRFIGIRQKLATAGHASCIAYLLVS